ncbi:MAG: inositol monophosphatase family protein [Halovenus sp.]
MSNAIERSAVVERSARAGGVVARESFRGALSVERKSNKNDLVTGADREAQRQVIATIRQEFPDATLVCEEGSIPGGTAVGDVDLRESVPEAGNAWVVDPIDGTANFVRGNRRWATVVATVTDGEPVAAATALPAQEDVYAAGPDSGTLNGDPLSVSDRADPETFAVSLLGWWRVGDGDRHASLFGQCANTFGDVRRSGSMQASLALVAGGSLDGAILPHPGNPWDTLAGAHLVRRAGGRVTDLDGNRWAHGADGMVVSNGEAHGTLVDEAQTALETGASH